ncbi:MAG TPA: asparagine synthase (glutamine-hydrolyzing) [Clostridia bacterium]
MCGIVGFWPGKEKFEAVDVLKKMSDSIIHRGPDDSGIWLDESTNAALGQRRLSIVDLSPMGHQPMMSSSGRYVIVFNGEIYNFNQIRKEIIDGHKGCYLFKGTSDTEVMLEAFECFGIEASVRKFVGMFAFAVFDRSEKKLYLVRDRVGEKPLYYGVVGSSFVFASEMKAMYVFPGFSNDINRDALALYFRYCYVPAPHTIYKGINKLMPGSILVVDWANAYISDNLQYWSFEHAVADGRNNQFKGNQNEAANRLEELLIESIKGQMVADVPVGAFLSGGIDSSLVVALMQSQSSKPVKTFTIGFNEQKFNEAAEAKKVATHLGTEHTELYVSPGEAMDVIGNLPHLYDEPFADPSQIPTFLVSRLARSKVTVSLSGDAGDELFGGYRRYFDIPKLPESYKWLPGGIRRTLAGALKKVSASKWDKIYGLMKNAVPQKKRIAFMGDKIHKFSDVLSDEDFYFLYMGAISHWKSPTNFVLGSNEPGIMREKFNNKGDLSKKELMMLFDSVTYLPDDILVKVDRASMGVSLESRVPFLDHRVIEFAWSLPIEFKTKLGESKSILRQILYKYVPKELIERPKMGFGVPVGEWIRGPLNEWAADLLDEKRIKNEGFLDYKIVSDCWKLHMSGCSNIEYYLWDILMFEAWLEKQKTRKFSCQ